MQLQYRPKFLPGARETSRARVARRLKGLPAPEPHTAPAALFGDARPGPYVPGRVLVHDDEFGVLLFRDGPPASWPDGRDPASPAARATPPAWRLWLEGAVLVAAIIAGGIVGVRLH